MSAEVRRTAEPDTIRADFDRLARCEGDRWDHNCQYHRFLLEHVPSHCASALDIGCGKGDFTRLLAERADRVLGLDLSAEMIRVARERSQGYANIELRVGDALAWDMPAGGVDDPRQFDCIASIATLHHLPMAEMLRRMREALRPGGTLLVLDLRASRGWAERLADVVAAPLSVGLKMIHNRRLRQPAADRDAWAEHGRHDVYPTMAEVRRACAGILPGAKITRHLFWRYSIVWTK